MFPSRSFCCRMLRKSGWLSMSQSPDSSRLRFRSARRSARLPKIIVLSCSDDMFGNLRQNSGLNDCGDASQGQDDKQQQCPCTHTTTKPSSAHAHANTTLRGSMHFFNPRPHNFSLKNSVRCGWRRACLSLYSEENTVTGFEVPAAAFPQLAAARCFAR